MNKASSKKVTHRFETVTSIAIRGNQNKVPTLVEMIAACDLKAERHPDAVPFEKAPVNGGESF